MVHSGVMEIDSYTAGLAAQLRNAAGAAGPEVEDAAQRLTLALEPALRLTIQRILEDAAGEVTLQLDGLAAVEVRLRGGAPELVVNRLEQSAPAATEPVHDAPPEDAFDLDSPATTRFTLRVPETLKSEVDRAAAAFGVSVNTWFVRAAQSALLTPPTVTSPAPTTRRARNLSGWVG